ncbi:MAG TPA: SAVED domain-containing protein [Thermodesulfobacteriota bacterium]|nr:SAVED domain-containing protein [Thermodesulfobacteriota bacterium]
MDDETQFPIEHRLHDKKDSSEKAKKPGKERRPKIHASVQLKLWVAARGRCEFYGCNEYLLKDGLTLKETNYSNIAHIVSWQPTGPRGDDPLPLNQRNKFENLMLVCTKHHILIDSTDHVNDYPKDLLLSFKKMHEERIDIICSAIPECITTLVRLKANIGGEIVKISDSEVIEAIFPNYLSNGCVEIDLTGLPGDGETPYWETMKLAITEKIDAFYRLGFGNNSVDHLSVFAIGPIPLLIHLGFCIGNKTTVHLYQRHRDTQCWKWKEKADELIYTINKLSEGEDSQEVALVLSLSGKIHKENLPEEIIKKLPIYEISLDAPKPYPGFLKTKDDLERFREKYQEILAMIVAENKNIKKIHLFPAVPAPIAVLCGRELLHKAHPPLIVYDYNNGKEGFNFTLEVNSDS